MSVQNQARGTNGYQPSRIALRESTYPEQPEPSAPVGTPWSERRPLVVEAPALGWRGDPADLTVAATDHDAGARHLVTIIAQATPPWVAAAACAGTPTAMFFPKRGGQNAAAVAIAICNECDVLTECRTWALSSPDPTCGHGIAGGMTPRQRRQARARARR